MERSKRSGSSCSRATAAYSGIFKRKEGADADPSIPEDPAAAIPVDCRPLAASAAMEPSQVEAESLRVALGAPSRRLRGMGASSSHGARHLRKFMEFDSFVLNFVIGFRLNRGGYKGVPHGVRGVPLLISRDVFSILSYSNIVQNINWRIRSTIFIFEVFSYSKYRIGVLHSPPAYGWSG